MKKWCTILLGIIILIVGLFFIRLVLPSQVDDVNPLINCSDELLNLADVYFIIPKFESVNISNDWCKEISDKNKELAMHGVYHTYREFDVKRSEEYFNEGFNIFENCFGFNPERFKPGQLKLASENNWIKEKMKVELFWNQFFHKVYHCEDSGVFPNWFIRIF